MDKNRFYLIVLLGIIILIFLFNQYTKIKQETLEKQQNIQTLTQKIKEIKYLQNLYKNDRFIYKLKKINKCSITQTDKYKIACKELNDREFKKISNLIFNSNANISKFNIEKSSIYVEIIK